MSQPKQPNNLCHSPATYVIPSNLCYNPATYVTAQQLMLQPSNLCHSPTTYVTAQQRQSLIKAEFGKGRV
jgi:hypothetical protein